MSYLSIDFETKDPYLSKNIDLGPGWVYMLKNPNSLAFPIGVALGNLNSDMTIDDVEYLDLLDPLQREYNVDKLKQRIQKASHGIIMHNAQYDLGYLLALGIEIQFLKVFDTKIIAHLYNNNLPSYSLDALSQQYLTKNSQKEIFQLLTIVDQYNLAPFKKSTATYTKKAKDWAYEHMDLLQLADFSLMSRYATQDIYATLNLFIHFIKEVSLEQAAYWSNFQLICTKNRAKGLAVYMPTVYSGIEKLEPIVKDLQDQVFKEAGLEFNINSATKQLAPIFEKLGFIKRTSKGNLSANKEFLHEISDKCKLAALVLKYREVNTVLNNFFYNIRDIQQYTCPSALAGGEYGRVYPQMDVFGTVTGRFSSSKPNIQQIPKRSKDYGALCRSMFVPDDPANKWYSLDWSNQEGRLAIHYANLIGAPGASSIRDEWISNPFLDMHQKVADMAKITRSQAKTINLGLLYSMGEASLCKKLGLSTEFKTISNRMGMKQVVEIAGPEGRKLLDRYRSANPYLKALNDRAKAEISRKGYILTLNGRKVRREDPRFDYRALNKLIQPSAADQMLMAYKAADDEGIDIKCLVHDEFNIEGQVDDAKKMKHIMEHVVELSVPMVAEVKGGTSWGTLEEVKDDA